MEAIGRLAEACRSARVSAAEQTVRVGVAGLGYWGPNLARNLAAIPGCRAGVAVRSRPRPHANGSPQRTPSARVTADLQELLEDPELDAVVLATPVPTHAELAVAVAQAGKHCFVEKPLATTADDAAAGGRRGRAGGHDPDGRPPARVPPGASAD